MDYFEIVRLRKKAKEVRLMTLEALACVGKGHIGGALSCVDILVALYYGGILRYNAFYPNWQNRDRFILSKGHVAVALYVVLSDVGFFDSNELRLLNNCAILGEHPDINIPGIEINSGSLGHGLGIGCGIAYAAKMDRKTFNIYILLGDGECYEGAIWEAAMFAAHHELDNLCVIVDRNMLCIHDITENINRLEPLGDKFKSFGWCIEIIDGHNFDQIIDATQTTTAKKPKVIIANTVKGKGVSFMENVASWHHGGITQDIYEKAKEELVSG
ncbi:MAG: transketolase [Gammaproteobacteria bacterium]|nr:transketolase [Gammaproteobacteria bacterium]